MAHHLTEKDKSALTATCSECGPATPIAKNGRYGFVCREARRQARRRYVRAHPDRVVKRPTSEHRLDKRDGSPDRCAVCGPVTPVVMGRGYGCPTRAKELGWKVFAEKPQPACPICRTFLDRFGACAQCDNEANVDDIFIPRESRRYASSSRVLADGYSIVDHDSLLPADTESVVPGWKTLGSLDPVGSRPTVRPDYAALYGSGKR